MKYCQELFAFFNNKTDRKGEQARASAGVDFSSQ
jgi:hypothetical protein